MFGVAISTGAYNLTNYGAIAYYPSPMKYKLPVRVDNGKTAAYVSIDSSGADFAGQIRVTTDTSYSELTYYHLNSVAYTPAAGGNRHRFLVIGYKV